MARIVWPKVPAGAGRITLPGEQAHYLLRVLRLRPGDCFRILDGRGRLLHARLEEISGRSATAEVLAEERLGEKASVQVHLAQSLIRGGRMDLVVQKATELGAAAVWPFISERTVAQPGSRSAARSMRWRKIAAEAARQCGRGHVPQVHEIGGFQETLSALPGHKVVLWEEEDSGGLREALGIAGAPGALTGSSAGEGAPRCVSLLIGPEGGFTVEEMRLARRAGCVSAGFGPRILRADTAAVAALAVTQHELGGLACIAGARVPR